MDNQRLLTWGLFLMMVWLTYQSWIQFNAPDVAEAPQAEAIQGELPSIDLPESTLPSSDALPSNAVTTIITPSADHPTITVLTDVMELEISTLGGTLIKSTMLKYPKNKDDPTDLVTLLDRGSDNLGLIRTGLRGAALHTSQMTAEAQRYSLDGADELRIPLTWTGDDGVRVTKTFVFKPGSYQIDVLQTIDNQSGAQWQGDQYAQLLRRSFPQERSMFDVDSYSFDGPIVYDGDSSEKLSRKDLQKGSPFKSTNTNGWVGSIQHHFLSVIVPNPENEQVFQVNVSDDVMVASTVGPKHTLDAGESATYSMTLFVGPKLQDQLEQIDPKLKLTVDYGFLTMLSQPMFWLLSLAYDYVSNWGVAIILVTLLIKLVFYKLTESSGRSMAKMRNLQPRMKALQERYKDDRQALSQAMMDLYKREKVNPVAGCLPILVQMPFFLAFYWVLVESVEMRQAPFALWLTDLSSRDPFFILPLIMGVAMFFQQKLNPAPADPVQAKVMQVMPVIFTGMFAFFPSGLVLYWVTNTILSIAQQWKVNKVVEAEEKAKKNRVKKKGEKEDLDA